MTHSRCHFLLKNFISAFKFQILQKYTRFLCVGTGAILSEEELAAMSPTAAAVAKIVKPGMKLTEVREVLNIVIFFQQKCSYFSETQSSEKLILKLSNDGCIFLRKVFLVLSSVCNI